MKVKFLNISKNNSIFKKQIINKFQENLKKSDFILGNDIKKLENKICKYLNSRFSVAVSSGTSGLYLSLKALNLPPNSEVITVSNSYLATVSSIVLAGLKPVIVDLDEDLNIDPSEVLKKINKKTKVIIAVHLTGNPCEIKKLVKICKIHNLILIEDAAQAIGSKIGKKYIGTFGHFSIFSFHPLKNLSGIGDGGIIICKNKKFYSWLIKARNAGHPNRDNCDFFSFNFRLDTFKASTLLIKLKSINKINLKRYNNAKLYYKYLKNNKNLFIPKLKQNIFQVFHLYIIRILKGDRTKFIEYLKKKNIETKIHYPIPIHKMKAFKSMFGNYSLPKTEKYSKQIISLPINEFLLKKEIQYICTTINNFDFNEK